MMLHLFVLSLLSSMLRCWFESFLESGLEIRFYMTGKGRYSDSTWIVKRFPLETFSQHLSYFMHHLGLLHSNFCGRKVN